MREELKEQDFCLEQYLCDAASIEDALSNFTLPKKWATFFKLLIRNGRELSDGTNGKLISIYMDIFHTFTNGRLTPKHIALAESVHHLTRSKHLITLLNRLGHCISYPKMEVIDQQIGAAAIESSKNGNVPLPSNIVKDPSLFLHGAIDNDDFNEETLDGKATTHITAMVLYQASRKEKRSEFHSTRRPLPESMLEKNCFSTLPCQEIQKCFSTNNKPLVSATSYMKFNHHKDLIEKSNFLWVLSRMSHMEDGSSSVFPEDAVVPGWTPFHESITTSDIPKTTVGFCTTLPFAPTNMDTVHTAIKNFMNLTSQVNRKYSILSCDMAIYLIAKKIQLQNTELNNLILRIGSFHVAKNWLIVLGQYLSGSGVAEMFVETDLYGENTVSAILRGTQYNRGVRAHKLLYEAIRRVQMDSFLRQYGRVSDDVFTKITNFQKIISSDKGEARTYYDFLTESSVEIFTEFQNFLMEELEANQNFKFWSNYCVMVDLLLDCIRAERDGLWHLHLQTVDKMIP